jgi:hypothetical protein
MQSDADSDSSDMELFIAHLGVLGKYYGAEPEPLAVIEGTGYGNCHAWIVCPVMLHRRYTCFRCHRSFVLRKDYTGSMCRLMVESGVPDYCRIKRVPAETAPAETAPAETAPAETAPAETAPSPKSEIHGLGYGSSHAWKRDHTAQVGSWGVKRSYYHCLICDEQFTHYYDQVPDIYDAMLREGVREVCPTG